ncbi:predicted protein [Thalassiosira pseudonana CCMP1335]|uniref:Uncharacterized protein n=1 Tax=Thalassiosira pseudonana TaxID=35128 RepID=B8BS71_THAPS|nr:predicted protein [Thalassiosira pseudonana CCMP1335]EED96669.1 predicted protein [Thalassiosira pseudonana CCMP1335]
MYVKLVGSGRGSMYNTCSADSKTLQKLTSVDLAAKPTTSDLLYNFYSIHNPQEYLGGGDATVIEQGPYKLRKHSVMYGVSQSSSALTDAADPDPKGSLEYSTANAYLVLDQDIKTTSNLKRNEDLSLDFSADKITLAETKRALASHLSMKDRVVNVSPDYLSFLGAMNDEVNMILSLVCTSEQIANIGVAGKAQCTDNQLGDVSANCACCMVNVDYEMAKSRNTGLAPAFTNCNSYFDEEGPVLPLLSLLAAHDGGVVVKSAGEKKYDGSGEDFVSTPLGQTEIHTALVQSHTVNDLMFGYPSAYLGRVAFLAQKEQAQQASLPSVTSTELATRMLTGQMDSDLSFKLGNIADYTSKVGLVCFAICTSGAGCSGYAPERRESSDADKIKLGGIDCKPYTSTFETVAKCAAIDAALQLNPNASGYENCVCANGSDEWSSQGCCLSGGIENGNKLSGEGCLYEVAGVVDPNYAGMDTSVANAIDLGTALQTWINKESADASSSFMCPAAGSGIDEHKKFGQYEAFAGSDEHLTYYHTGNDRMRQDDTANSASTAHMTAVSGSSGKYFAPKGLAGKVGTAQVTDGIPVNAQYPVYIPSAKKTIDFVFEGVRENFSRNKLCGTDACIYSARMIPNATSFSFVEDATDGTGLPYNGLQPIGHVKGPSTTGRPEYLHHPLYVDGDEALYTQQDNSFVERGDGNGIKIYRPKIRSDPGVFTDAATNYQLVDKAHVDEKSDELRSHVDFEVSTGLGARQRMRFGTSYSIWECDPSTNAKCKHAVNSMGGHGCYATTGASIFGGMSTNDKNGLTTLGMDNFTYPCSAANLLTPDVVAGKILPMYWFEESTIHATADEIDILTAFNASYAKSGNTFITVCGLAFLVTFLGMSMLCLCLCFEQKHSFMQSEVVPKKSTSAISSRSSAA